MSCLVIATLLGCGDSLGPEPPVASIVVTPPTPALFVGDTLRLLAEARSAAGAPLPGRGFAWTTDRGDIVAVDAAGLLTGRAVGFATISAASGGHTAQVQVEVMDEPAPNPPPPPSAPVISSMSPSTIQAGWSSFTLTVRGTGFETQSRVLWDGVPLETFYVDSTEVRSVVSASYVAREGTAEVTVENLLPERRVSNPLTFTVFARPALSVELRVPGNTVFVGNTVKLAAVALDQFGEIIEAKTIEWTSSDTTVAKIDGEFLRGLKPGATELRASAYPTSSGTTFFVVASPVPEIVFGTAPTGQPELFIRALDPAGGVRRLLPPQTVGRQAAPAPDGHRIAFTGRDAGGDEDIYVLNRDGTDLRRLTTEGGIDDQPAWSPDGAYIAFRSFRQGKSDVWVMDADGSNPRNLTFADAFVPEEYNDRPSWSPDSQTLVFSRGFGLGQALYKIGLDGTGLTEFLSEAGLDLLEPAWSPGGEYIAFRRHDRQQGSSTVEFVSSATGSPVYHLAPLQGSQTPSWIADEWIAVSAPVLPASTLSTVALWRLGFNNLVVPMGEEFGALGEAAGLAP